MITPPDHWFGGIFDIAEKSRDINKFTAIYGK